MYKAENIAEYFLSLSDPKCDDYISNLKLQKLLYYAQGFYLALYGKSLFNEVIEAWTYGPVVSSLYHKYKEYGPERIDPPKKIEKIDPKTKELLDDVWDVFGQYSAMKLARLTHEEPPWEEAAKLGMGSIISHDSMKKYFKTLLVNE